MYSLALALAVLAVAADLYILYQIADTLAWNVRNSKGLSASAIQNRRQEAIIALAYAVLLCLNGAFCAFYILTSL